MHRQDILVIMKRHRCPYGNRFLSDTTKPFADLVLPQQNKHFLFNHPWSEQAVEELFQQIIAILFPVKVHCEKILKFIGSRPDMRAFLCNPGTSVGGES